MLNSGANKTVCGWVWLDSYIDSLSEGQKANIVFQTSSNIYRFGHGETPQRRPKYLQILVAIRYWLKWMLSIVTYQYYSPAQFWNELIWTWTSKIIPHQFSAKLIEPVVVTKSGHSEIPFTVLWQIIHSQNSNFIVTPTLQTNLDKEKMAQKLHRRFAHVSGEKLVRLVNSAGSTLSQDSKLKGYLRYKTTTSQNVPSEAQIRNFFISKKNYVPFSRYSSFRIFNHPMIYQIREVTMTISTWDNLHFWIYLLNHNSWSHQTWSVDRYKQWQWFSVILWTTWRTGARFQVLCNLATFRNYSQTKYVKIPVFSFFENVNKGQLKIVYVNH